MKVTDECKSFMPISVQMWVQWDAQVRQADSSDRAQSQGLWMQVMSVVTIADVYEECSDFVENELCSFENKWCRYVSFLFHYNIFFCFIFYSKVGKTDQHALGMARWRLVSSVLCDPKEKGHWFLKPSRFSAGGRRPRSPRKVTVPTRTLLLAKIKLGSK